MKNDELFLALHKLLIEDRLGIWSGVISDHLAKVLDGQVEDVESMKDTFRDFLQATGHELMAAAARDILMTLANSYSSRQLKQIAIVEELIELRDSFETRHSLTHKENP